MNYLILSNSCLVYSHYIHISSQGICQGIQETKWVVKMYYFQDTMKQKEDSEFRKNWIKDKKCIFLCVSEPLTSLITC